MAAASSVEEANERNTTGHGYSNKRQRTEEGHRSSYHRAVDFEDEEDDQGCFCANTGCPWQWDGNGSSSSSSGSRSSNSRGSSSGSGGSMALAGVKEPSFFHGPLLSVKEYRDRPTGEVRFAVFQGDRQSNRCMSVAQILFTLKQRGDRVYGHVKSVRVNRDFRGMGLGPLLFKEGCEGLWSYDYGHTWQ